MSGLSRAFATRKHLTEAAAEGGQTAVSGDRGCV